MTQGTAGKGRRVNREARGENLTDAQIEAIVADAIAAEASAARTEATPPSGAIVWWRAQMRARQEAAQLADKPIAIVHAVAIACGVGLALSLLGIVIAAVRGSVNWLKDAATFYTSLAAPLAGFDFGGLMTLSMTATLLLLVIVSVAAVFVLGDE
jgi:hypothetical protein